MKTILPRDMKENWNPVIVSRILKEWEETQKEGAVVDPVAEFPLSKISFTDIEKILDFRCIPATVRTRTEEKAKKISNHLHSVPIR